ncbi:MAG: HAD family hydrolase [Gammaproteobacteria bacterium]|nr:MAG: HAD family hydrolase [Gammaproteobacteria bacterium]
MTIDLVIFDCDGVLVDSERLAVRIEGAALAELGLAFSEDELVERFVGVTDAYFRKEVEAHLGRPLPEDWDELMAARYQDAYRNELTPVDGVLEALDAIAYPNCVASNGSHRKMAFTLGITGLHARFAGRIFSAYDVTRGKPAPDLFLHAAEHLGVDPSGCVVVEDSPNGVAAARAAGMHVFAYAGGLTPAARLEGPATTVFEDMRVLPSLLEVHRSRSH